MKIATVDDERGDRSAASDPIDQALQEAPFDDEPATGEDLAELEAAEYDLNEGHVLSHDEARRTLLPGTEIGGN